MPGFDDRQIILHISDETHSFAEAQRVYENITRLAGRRLKQGKYHIGVDDFDFEDRGEPTDLRSLDSVSTQPLESSTEVNNLKGLAPVRESTPYASKRGASGGAEALSPSQTVEPKEIDQRSETKTFGLKEVESRRETEESSPNQQQCHEDPAESESDGGRDLIYERLLELCEEVSAVPQAEPVSKVGDPNSARVQQNSTIPMEDPRTVRSEIRDVIKPSDSTIEIASVNKQRSEPEVQDGNHQDMEDRSAKRDSKDDDRDPTGDDPRTQLLEKLVKDCSVTGEREDAKNPQMGDTAQHKKVNAPGETASEEALKEDIENSGDTVVPMNVEEQDGTLRIRKRPLLLALFDGNYLGGIAKRRKNPLVECELVTPSRDAQASSTGPPERPERRETRRRIGSVEATEQSTRLTADLNEEHNSPLVGDADPPERIRGTDQLSGFDVLDVLPALVRTSPIDRPSLGLSVSTEDSELSANTFQYHERNEPDIDSDGVQYTEMVLTDTPDDSSDEEEYPEFSSNPSLRRAASASNYTDESDTPDSQRASTFSPPASPGVFTCSLCEKSCRNENGLKVHSAKVHGLFRKQRKRTQDELDLPNKEERCTRCPARFVQPENLRRHLMFEHYILEESETPSQ